MFENLLDGESKVPSYRGRLKALEAPGNRTFNKMHQVILNSLNDESTARSMCLKLGVPEEAIALESDSPALESDLLRRVKKLFTESKKDKLSATGHKDRKAKLLALIKEMRAEIKGLSKDSYVIKKASANLPHQKEAIDFKTLNSSLSEMNSILAVIQEYYDKLYSQLAPNLFKKGASLGYLKVEEITEKFFKDLHKSLGKGFSKDKAVIGLMGKFFKENKTTEVLAAKSLAFLGDYPVFVKTTSGVDLFHVSPPAVKPLTKVKVSRADVLKLLDLAEAELKEDRLSLDDYISKYYAPLAKRIGFDLYYDDYNQGWIDEDEWEGSVGEKYFDDWGVFIEAAEHFIWQQSNVPNPEYVTDEQNALVTNMLRIVAQVCDEN